MDYDPLAELYELQYATYRDDLEFYTRLAQDYGGPVLELGAGTGRVTRALARTAEVVALEPSLEMRTKGAAHTKGLPVRWVEGDMRTLSLRRKFPLIVAPFNALMHLYTLDDQDRALAGVKKHLAKGGRFAFDLYNPAHIGPPRLLQHEGSYETETGQVEVFIRQEHYPEAQMLLTHYYLDHADLEGRLTRQRRTLEQRYYTRYELERWLRSAGFSYRLFGGFYGEPFREDAPTLAFVAWL